MSIAKGNLTIDKLEKKRSRPKKGIFWETKTRIFAWYSAIAIGFLGLSVPLFSEFIFFRINIRVQQELSEQLEAFEKYVAQESSNLTSLDKFTQAELAKVFETFLDRQIPSDDTFAIAFLDGRFYRSSPRGRPDLLRQDGELMQRWANTTKNEGEYDTSNPDLGKVIYLATPVIVDGQVLGVYVLAHTSAGEIKEATDVIIIVVGILLIVLVLALILAWLASEKILSLMRSPNSKATFDRSPQPSVENGGNCIMMSAFTQDSFTDRKDLINHFGKELQTPLAVVRGHLEFLGKDPIVLHETIELVMDELDRMSGSIDDFILFTKARSDLLNLETIDLELFTQELFNQVTILAERNWKLDTKGQADLFGDRHRLLQTMMYLAENATQSTVYGDTIAIGSALRGDFIRLWVRHTGTGIASDSQLKLLIVKAIAEAHGGNLELISKVGLGSSATLVLPLKR